MAALLMSCCCFFFFFHIPLSISAQDADSEVSLPIEDARISLKGKCDIFSGKWIPSHSEPPYTTATCNFMESRFDCMKYGRPDRGYLHWRWKPHGCELPLLVPDIFLNIMRHKSWGFIGDSLARNQLEALVCLLSKVEEPLQTFCDNRSETWYFPLHNITITNIWAPFLLKADIFLVPASQKKRKIHLYLDTLESKWTTEYHTYDYIVISPGQWFTNPTIVWDNGKIVGCHDCQGDFRELGIPHPYRKALQSALHFITTSDHKPRVFFRTSAPDHFKDGQWFNGGVCNRTAPFKEGEYGGKYVDCMMHAIDIEEYEKAAAFASERGVHIGLLDIYHLSLLRPDGHPGRYKDFHFQAMDEHNNAVIPNDCLHWCIPGPVDTWNDLMMEILLNEFGPKYA